MIYGKQLGYSKRTKFKTHLSFAFLALTQLFLYVNENLIALITKVFQYLVYLLIRWWVQLITFYINDISAIFLLY